MPLFIHDTLQRKKVEFKPREAAPGQRQRITLYVCGPTVYNYAHIGNARPVVVFDVLYRLLQRLYPEAEVIYARNITDVEDKINAAAIAEGVPISTITDKFARIYNEDMARLGALPPTIEPRATQHMAGMINLIEKLLEAEAAYVSAGEVLFDVAAYEANGGQYGALSGRSLEDMVAGARVEVAENKRNAADFVLWKPSKADEPAWDGPLDPKTETRLKGRPGWHIECSAMAEAVLGLPIDIHGGGHDLIFPHHTNEIAQSCAAHGATNATDYARYWMHNGFLDFSGEKMSKSLGNVVLVHDLLKQYPGEVIRWALLSGHYRSPLDWTPELLEQSRKQLDYIYGVLRRARSVVTPEYSLFGPSNLLDFGFSDLLDDLNTAGTIAKLHRQAAMVEEHIKRDQIPQAAHEKAVLLILGGTLGFFHSWQADGNGTPQDPDAWFEGGADDDFKAKVDGLLKARHEARAAKDFATADRIRGDLDALNVMVMDSPAGATWRMKE